MITVKQLLKGSGALTYTSPVSVRTTVRAMSAYNGTAGAVACTVSIASEVIDAKTLAAGESWIFSKAINQTLEAGDTLVTAGTGVNFLASGYQEPV